MHRVMARSPEGEWIQLYEGTRKGCLLFIRRLPASTVKVVTRRSAQEWRQMQND